MQVESGYTHYEVETERISIGFDINCLKGILEFDKEKIEEFINIAMHEQGHSIQYLKKENRVNAGFMENKIINKNLIKRLYSRDIIINEFAEVINANRLENGNIENDDKYWGYKEIQTAAKIILNSLGISELELANLQFEQDARKEYENLIANRLGRIPSQVYRNSFGNILDSIYNFSKDSTYDSEEEIFLFSNNEKRKDLILQIDSLQILSKDLFEKRFYDIIRNSNNTLKDLAKLSIEQGHASIELLTLFDEFNIKDYELQENEGKDIHTMLSELGYDDKYLETLYYVECDELIEIQHQKDKQKYYDNKELIERLYQSFLRYPIRKVPLKDIPRVILAKIIGKKKRKDLEAEKLLLESNVINHDRHTDFVNRLSNLEEYKENEIIEQKDYIIEFKEGRDTSNENNREN